MPNPLVMSPSLAVKPPTLFAAVVDRVWIPRPPWWASSEAILPQHRLRLPPVSEVFVARSAWLIAFPAAWAPPAVIRLAARIRLAENSFVFVLIEVPLVFLAVKGAPWSV